ncbi:solute carrier family 35 member F6-like isoform X2 [Babylonia areolata]|uniref:solute carrier family 35 member F6-like isoform X1 n=1 Tax=Babylonia areolata TaxID=304850 RepID=UPI003FD576D9
MALTCVQVALMIGMLITGSINTLSKKAQNDCQVKGYLNSTANNTATAHSFDHPWFQTWIMFIGECSCLFGLYLARRKERKQFIKEMKWATQLGREPQTPPEHPRVFQWIFLLPTGCDLVGTSVAGIGLLYVDASVWQMLRGSIIIFAGILSKVFLKRKLYPVHWLGMVVVMGGLVLVGCSSLFRAHHSVSASHTLLGILLIMGSQLISAAQMVIEERFLKNRNFHPLQVVGMEGSFGLFLMTFAVLPAMYFIPGSGLNGRYENSVDALYQIANSPRLLVFCLLYLISIAFYNYFGLAVTKSLTAVHRTLIDACRTILVWVADLVIYYGVDKKFGEEFDKSYGLLQVDGFMFLVVGTMLYNQVMVVPCLPWCNPPVQVELEAIIRRPDNDEGPTVQGSDTGPVDILEPNLSSNENTALLSDAGSISRGASYT